MADYMVSVERPSGSGLKLELDRMRRDAEELIRGAKKSRISTLPTARSC